MKPSRYLTFADWYNEGKEDMARQQESEDVVVEIHDGMVWFQRADGKFLHTGAGAADIADGTYRLARIEGEE